MGGASGCVNIFCINKMNQQICIYRKDIRDKKYYYCTKDIPEKFHIHQNDIIGTGRYGVVLGGFIEQYKSGYTALSKIRTPIAAKFIPLDVVVPSEKCLIGKKCIYSLLDFEKEVEYSKLFGDVGISPEVYFSGVLDISDYEGPVSDKPKKMGVIVMERFGISLEELKKDKKYLKEHEKEIMMAIEKKLKILFDMGFIHRDIHYGNILFDDGKIKLIDLDLDPVIKGNTWEEEKLFFEYDWNLFMKLK